MLHLFFCALPLFNSTDYKLEPKLNLAQVNEEEGLFLQTPIAIDIDHHGRFLIADAEARTVFVWEKDGSYQGRFGNAGDGPGELNFGGMAGYEGSLISHNNYIYIWDGGRRLLNRYTLDLKFDKAFPLPINARVEQLSLTADGNVIVFYRKISMPATMGLALYKMSGEVLKNISEEADPAYELILENGSFKGIFYHGFAAEYVFHHDLTGGRIIYGNSEKSSFQTYLEDGRASELIQFKTPRIPVTDADHEEFRARLGNSPTSKVDFTEFKPYYTHVAAHKGGYLVYLLSPHYRNIKGHYLDKQGGLRGNFSYQCGEQGGIFSIRGRLLSMETGEEGDFFIRELELKNR